MENFTSEELDLVMKRQKQREQEFRDSLGGELKNISGPVPNEMLKALTNQFITDFHKLMLLHPGYPFYTARSSYRQIVTSANLCFDDLIDLLIGFEAEVLATDPRIFHREEEQRLSNITSRVQKELFAASNVIAATVKHARVVRKRFQPNSYNETRAAVFREHGLHEFWIVLRVLLHHIVVVDAGYNSWTDYQSGETGATFSLAKDRLQRAVEEEGGSLTAGQRDGILTFLSTSGDHVDLRAVATTYRARLNTFSDYLNSEMAAEGYWQLHDYDRCMLEKKRRDTRLMWRALLGNIIHNWSERPDPLLHLPKFLARAEVYKALSYESYSKEQVDYVIATLDKYGAIDEGLRQMVYSYFGYFAK